MVLTAEDPKFSMGKYSFFTDGIKTCFNPSDIVSIPCHALGKSNGVKYISLAEYYQKEEEYYSESGVE